MLNHYACRQDPLSKMPDFSFRLSDSLTVISSRNFPEHKPIVLVYFESDCRECQQTTDSLLQNFGGLKNAAFYFLSIEHFDQVRLFRDYYHLDRYDNITVGQDYSRHFIKHFKSYSTPFIALYSSRRRLVGMYKGKPVVKDLVQAIASLN